jgi:hypothetical protein
MWLISKVLPPDSWCLGFDTMPETILNNLHWRVTVSTEMDIIKNGETPES